MQWIFFAIAFFLTILFTPLVKRVAIVLHITDQPDHQRKRHERTIPLAGGLAIFLAFWLTVIGIYFFSPFLHHHIQPLQLVFVAGGSCILLVVGLWDDWSQLAPRYRLVATALAAFLVALGGTELRVITNPFGGTFLLDFWQITLPFLSTVYVAAALLVFVWLMGMMYTTKILDGLDGLTTGVVAIGAGMIYLLAVSPRFFQPDVAVLSLVLCGVALGFLCFNFYPAKIFLGESGGLLLGFLLGTLAIIAGGKFAIALVVMAVPVFDLLRVIAVRWFRHQSIFIGDREHLHFKLVDNGLAHPVVVGIFYLVAASLGGVALLLNSVLKYILLSSFFLLMCLFSFFLSRSSR